MTRQSMNVLLQSLERDGDVVRPPDAAVGKVLPAQLTARGRRKLAAATAAVRSVEVRMTDGLSEAERAAALTILRRMVDSLRDEGPA